MTDSKYRAEGLINKEDSLLVIIDVQEKLLPVMADKDLVKENVIKLARFARIVHLPVIVTEQEKLGPTIPEITAELTGVKTFGKITFDCFGDEGIRASIGLTGRTTLILAGIEAHICVAQTAISALGKYHVHAVGDAMSSRAPQNHEIAIHRIRQAGAVVTSTEMVMYELLGKAGTQEFRECLKLVK